MNIKFGGRMGSPLIILGPLRLRRNLNIRVLRCVGR